MALDLRLQLKLSQQLVMTPQLQQAIKLLQLNRLELAETVQQEIEQNPVLEETTSSQDQEDGANSGPEEQPTPVTSDRVAEVKIDDGANIKEIDWQDYANEYEPMPSFKGRDDNDLPSRLDILTKKPDLHSHLQWQLQFTGLTPEEEEVGHYIIGNINRDGFLEADLENITNSTSASPETVEKLLTAVQAMDPAGIGARNVQESLLLQLDRLGQGESTAAVIIRDHLKLMETRNYAGIVKATGRPRHEIKTAIALITSLDPFPGRQFSDEEPHYIIPDVYIHKLDGEYVIQMNNDGLPQLRVSNFYRNALKQGNNTSGEAREYIQEKMKSAAWLIKSIQQRQRTIYKVVESIIKFQRQFLEEGVEHLRPLVLRDVAEDIEMHESTISRVTNNKYVHTPQGIFELKYFFNSAIERRDGGDSMSSVSVKNRIKAFIQKEDPLKPLSDQAISDKFKEANISLARRTVAKYREQMGIPTSKLRKKPKF